MNKSESIKSLAEALNKAQAEMPFATMDSVNFFKSKYADLGNIIKTAKPILSKFGLAISQNVEGANNMIGVTTLLMHSSGEWLESSVFLPVESGKSTAQAAGATITYLRRYAYAAVLGMYSDEDTDGETKTVKPAPNGHKAGITLEEACAIKASDGKLYGDIPTDLIQNKLNSMANSKKELTDEALLKIEAMKLILKARADKVLPEPTGVVEQAQILGGQPA